MTKTSSDSFESATSADKTSPTQAKKPATRKSNTSPKTTTRRASSSKTPVKPKSSTAAKPATKPTASTTRQVKTAQTISTTLPKVEPRTDNIDGFGRIPVLDVFPVIENGAYPAKAVIGEALPVRATIFREGHDAVGASVILTSPAGVETRTDMEQIEPMGLNHWQAWVRPDARGRWTFRVESWSAPWRTWLHNARVKLPVNQDVALVCLQAEKLFHQAAKLAEEAKDKASVSVLTGAALMMLPERPVDELLEVINSKSVTQTMAKYEPRELVCATKEFPIQVDRKRALFSSWYEFFPRSQGATYDEKTNTWTSGTFKSSYERLEAAAKMGFDVVYLPPIHPIGDQFRKGRNNSLSCEPGDPGSPWAIGSKAGGHFELHPDLGTFADFDKFVAKANDLGLEVAMDLALQCSPDHPWVVEHPEWFSIQLDGTIAYAENPPKKYQDIYPLNFDNDPKGIYAEIYRLIEFWVGHGVKIFRVDNPHTKPINFWDWVVNAIHQQYPDVLFLAEAFTLPAMMQTLGKIGFDLSYTYFAWRTTKYELTTYLNEVSQQTAHQYRPSFWVNTPDINPLFVRSGNPAAFVIRTVLASMMSPSWGMYSGWELLEHVELKPGGEEYLNSEKYEFRPRNFDQDPNINLLIGTLNGIRKDHPALQQLRNTTVQNTSNDDVFAFSKVDGDDRVIVVCSVVPERTVEAVVSLDMASLGLHPSSVLKVRDELTGRTFVWGDQNFVRLPPDNPAHILTVLED